MRFTNFKYLLALLFLLKTEIGQTQQIAPLPDNIEVITKINTPNPDPSGIAVSKSGRIFLGFPRHADNHTSFALVELINQRLVPFPNKEYVYPSTKPYADWLVSPHGIFMDKNDVLWVLDDGKRAGIKEIPLGAAKVVGIDINTKKIIRSVVIPKSAMGDDSHLNDLRVDPDKGFAYIANSGFGERYSLIVVNLATGQAREILKNTVYTSPDPGFMAFLEYQPHSFDATHPTFPIGGADGITLSPAGSRLYWTAISGRKLFSISTDSIINFQNTEQDLEKSVHFEGEHPACDGIDSDSLGNLYFGAFEQLSLTQRTPDGKFHLLAHDNRLGWPDGLAYHNGYLYVTLGQWNRLAGFNNGKNLRQPPYLVIRVKTIPTP